jgi:hypothetical protein
MNKTLIWLDDFRNPFKNNWLVFTPCNDYSEVIWLKTYVDFVDYIQTKGLPYAICFDHDLQDYIDGVEKTGFDCAKYLVDYCIDNDKDLPLYNIQSSNPSGKDNINGLLQNYNKFRKK